MTLRTFFFRRRYISTGAGPRLRTHIMAVLFAANYDGLRKKETYDELVDQLGPGNRELKEPDRRAKQLRETPQIAGLLDGEGMTSFVELGKQQLAAASHQRVEESVREAASAPGAAPAQEMRAASSQTSGPRMRNVKSQAGVESGDRFAQTDTARFADAGSQAWRAQTQSGGAQTDPTGQMFDLTSDDRMDEDARDLEEALGAHDAALEQRRENLKNIISRHLGEEVTRTQQEFAHRMAIAAQQAAPTGRSSSSGAQPMEEDKSAEKRGREDAEGSTAPKRKAKAKAPRQKARAEVLEPPMEVDPPLGVTGQKRQQAPEGDPNVRSKPKKRASKSDPALPAPAVSREDPGAQPSSSSSANPESTGDTGGSGEARPRHNIEKIEGKTKAWWSRQNITVIKSQAELRGHRFTDLETKGGMVRKGGRQVKQPKMKKAEYLETLLRILGL